MALLDNLFSALTGQAPIAAGQTAGALQPGQANGAGAQANFPMSELLAQSTQREMPTQQSTTAPVTVSPQAAAPQNAPSDPVATGQPAPSAQGISAGDQTLMSGAPDDPQSDAQAIAAHRAAVGRYQAENAATPPQGGMANPGLYGLLPAGLQHGVLRNVLGAIGDAFTGKGLYEDRMQRQELGNAAAGINMDDPTSVQEGLGRIGTTGATGAPELMDKVMTQEESARLRKQVQEQNFQYRDAVIKDREHYHDEETANRNNGRFQQMAGAAIADLSRATNADDYAAKLSALNYRIKLIDPNLDATSVYGAPLNYTPGFFDSQSGMTNAQAGQQANVVRGQDLQHQVGMGRNEAIAGGNASRAASAKYNTDQNVGARESTFESQYTARKQAGLPTSPEDDQRFQHDTQVSSRSRRAVPASTLTPGGVPVQRTTDPSQMIGTGANGALQTLSRAQATEYAKRGLHVRFIGNDGKHYHT